MVSRYCYYIEVTVTRIIQNVFFRIQGSPRKDNDSCHQSGGGGAFQVYRRPTTGQLPVPVVNSSATPEKKPAVSSNTTSTATKSLTSVIDDHQRRGDVLRKQQQILTKQLFDIQVNKICV